MAKHWRIRAHDPERIAALARGAGIPAVLAQLLVARGIEHPDSARAFLEPKLSGLRDPEELPGISAAADRVMDAVRRKDRIVIYGDYDVDGITATATLVQCLAMLGGAVSYYVPHRIDEGYGLNDDALSTLAAQGTRMVVTVDCGVASVSEAETARRLGLELIVTDHHEFAAELPAAAAIVHPRLPGHAYPFGGLSGSGVAFKLAWALCQRASGAKKVSEGMRNFLLSAVGLAAMGTVADVVPLVDENRILVRNGLAGLRQSQSLGLAALVKLAGLENKSQFDSEDVGFTLGPRLNAAGRLGQAQLAVELLVTTSRDRAAALAEYVNELNGSRQSLERSIYLAAHKQAQEEFDPENDAALVLAGRGWHPGVIGIVAGKLAEKYHRPVVMIALDDLGVKPGIGSARSVPGFDLHRALATCGRRLIAHGGHAAAAGLRVDERQVDEFREEFRELAASEIAAGDRAAEIWIDAEAPLSTLSAQVVERIEQLAPFGHGNPRPMLCASDVALAEPPKRIGDGRHLAVKVSQHGQTLRGVAFGNGDWAEELAAVEGPLSIAFRPVINDFRGRRNVELHLVDWRVG